MIEHERDQQSRFALYEFMVHIFVGSVTFVILAMPAIGLSVGIDFLQDRIQDAIIIWFFRCLEYVLLLGDGLLFLIYMTKSFINVGKYLWAREL